MDQTVRDSLPSRPDEGLTTAPSAWRLERHSGRTGEPWREVWKGDNEKEARGRYDAVSTALRQGGVTLFRGEDVVLHTHAPRLRTRW
jgi:hypothetical protein